jgi:hypothetical protein
MRSLLRRLADGVVTALEQDRAGHFPWIAPPIDGSRGDGFLGRLVLTQIPEMIEPARLQVGLRGRDVGQRRFGQDSSVTSSTLQSTTSWMKLMFLYSPEATREITSRRVTSGSTTASRPRRP